MPFKYKILYFFTSGSCHCCKLRISVEKHVAKSQDILPLQTLSPMKADISGKDSALSNNSVFLKVLHNSESYPTQRGSSFRKEKYTAVQLLTPLPSFLGE